MVFAVLVAWIVLGRPPAPVQLAGGSVITAGVALVRIDDLRAPIEPNSADRAVKVKSAAGTAEAPVVDASTVTALTDLVVGDALGAIPVRLQAFVGMLMIATAAWTARRPGRTRAAAFFACTLVWARANHGLEGLVLVTLTPDHGLTMADLLPPALLALVLARVAALASGAVPASRYQTSAWSTRPQRPPTGAAPSAWPVPGGRPPAGRGSAPRRRAR